MSAGGQQRPRVSGVVRNGEVIRGLVVAVWSPIKFDIEPFSSASSDKSNPTENDEAEVPPYEAPIVRVRPLNMLSAPNMDEPFGTAACAFGRRLLRGAVVELTSRLMGKTAAGFPLPVCRVCIVERPSTNPLQSDGAGAAEPTEARSKKKGIVSDDYIEIVVRAGWARVSEDAINNATSILSRQNNQRNNNNTAPFTMLQAAEYVMELQNDEEFAKRQGVGLFSPVGRLSEVMRVPLPPPATFAGLSLLVAQLRDSESGPSAIRATVEHVYDCTSLLVYLHPSLQTLRCRLADVVAPSVRQYSEVARRRLVSEALHRTFSNVLLLGVVRERWNDRPQQQPSQQPPQRSSHAPQPQFQERGKRRGWNGSDGNANGVEADFQARARGNKDDDAGESAEEAALKWMVLISIPQLSRCIKDLLREGLLLPEDVAIEAASDRRKTTTQRQYFGKEETLSVVEGAHGSRPLKSKMIRGKVVAVWSHTHISVWPEFYTGDYELPENSDQSCQGWSPIPIDVRLLMLQPTPHPRANTCGILAATASPADLAASEAAEISLNLSCRQSELQLRESLREAVIGRRVDCSLLPTAQFSNGPKSEETQETESNSTSTSHAGRKKPLLNTGECASNGDVSEGVVWLIEEGNGCLPLTYLHSFLVAQGATPQLEQLPPPLTVTDDVAEGVLLRGTEAVKNTYDDCCDCAIQCQIVRSLSALTTALSVPQLVGGSHNEGTSLIIDAITEDVSFFPHFWIRAIPSAQSSQGLGVSPTVLLFFKLLGVVFPTVHHRFNEEGLAVKVGRGGIGAQLRDELQRYLQWHVLHRVANFCFFVPPAAPSKLSVAKELLDTSGKESSTESETTFYGSMGVDGIDILGDLLHHGLALLHVRPLLQLGVTLPQIKFLHSLQEEAESEQLGLWATAWRHDRQILLNRRQQETGLEVKHTRLPGRLHITANHNLHHVVDSIVWMQQQRRLESAEHVMPPQKTRVALPFLRGVPTSRLQRVRVGDYDASTAPLSFSFSGTAFGVPSVEVGEEDVKEDGGGGHADSMANDAVDAACEVAEAAEDEARLVPLRRRPMVRLQVGMDVWVRLEDAGAASTELGGGGAPACHVEGEAAELASRASETNETCAVACAEVDALLPFASCNETTLTLPCGRVLAVWNRKPTRDHDGKAILAMVRLSATGEDVRVTRSEIYVLAESDVTEGGAEKLWRAPTDCGTVVGDASDPPLASRGKLALLAEPSTAAQVGVVAERMYDATLSEMIFLPLYTNVCKETCGLLFPFSAVLEAAGEAGENGADGNDGASLPPPPPNPKQYGKRGVWSYPLLRSSYVDLLLDEAISCVVLRMEGLSAADSGCIEYPHLASLILTFCSVEVAAGKYPGKGPTFSSRCLEGSIEKGGSSGTRRAPRWTTKKCFGGS